MYTFMQATRAPKNLGMVRKDRLSVHVLDLKIWSAKDTWAPNQPALVVGQIDLSRFCLYSYSKLFPRQCQ